MLHILKLRFTSVAFIFGLIALAGIGANAQDRVPVSPNVERQIQDIYAIKASLSAGEKKMTSSLVFAGRQARSSNFRIGTSDAPLTVDTSMIDADGMVEVDIDAQVTDGLLKKIVALNGRVVSAFPKYRSIRAFLPITAIDTFAAESSVRSVREAEKPMLNSASAFSESLRASVQSQPAVPFPFVGSLTTQGYISHRAKEVAALGITGAGIKVGVLSDSASAARVSALMTSGDLGPGTTVLPGQASSGTDEGTAMMEIVQDMAPGAQVYFATANGGQAQMATNITALAAAGCKVIVDDISYFAEPSFQDGPISQAINAFTAAGGIYFSSAANSGSLLKGTSGTWEGDFLSGGNITGPIATAGETGLVHNFGPNTFNALTGASRNISLKWSDPLGGSTNDYDVFVLNPAGTTIKGFSAAVQNGTQDPVEFIQLPASGANSAAVGDRVVVVLFSGATRAIRIDTHRGILTTGTTGSTFGHNAAASVVTVAATSWNSAKLGTVPFTGAANGIETFSSDGPRKIFYNSNGSVITPGNLLFGTNGGNTLQKPDITAADGVSTKTPGFFPFYGTSAAAPHGAGIAALVFAAKPTLTGAQVRQIIASTALDNMAAGFDINGGSGVAMALASVQAAQALP
ncbi:MAG: S8 family serine peptidase [Pyrinomonadaceae bacterium]